MRLVKVGWHLQRGLFTSVDQVAEQSGQKLSQVIAFKCSPLVTYFIQPYLLTQRFHNHPKECHRLGTECSDTISQMGRKTITESHFRF